jgi:hypothetical protein
LQQALSHTAVRKSAAQAAITRSRRDHDAVIIKRDLDFVAWVKLGVIAESLRDHDLPLGTNPRRHT